MNGLNNSNDDSVECPLCMEPLEVDDLTFFPCTCGYQICRFCWHRIRTDENKLCPACRKEYPENPADFKPLSQEEMIAFKSQKRQRDQQRKQKITENRKHLANVRVVQKNLVFVVGLPPRLADADILKKHEYFGKYGKIHKVVINPSTTYAGLQGPSASAYVTYVHNTDALRAIQSVNNIMIDGRLIKTSLGTTKYCSHFMKNQQCPKGDCMYLHDLGDPEASFTKEEMHQGKHQEYEKRLHDALIASAGAANTPGMGSGSSEKPSTGGNSKTSGSASMSSSSSTTSSTSSVAISNAVATATASQQKEAWPSLSVSPVNSKEASSSNGNGKNKKDKSRNEKSRHEKGSKAKSKITAQSNTNANKENFISDSKDNTTAVGEALTANAKSESSSSNNRSRADRNKDKASSNRGFGAKGQQSKESSQPSAANTSLEHKESNLSSASVSTANGIETSNGNATAARTVSNAQRSFSSSSDISDDRDGSESNASGKSTPGDLYEIQCDSSESIVQKRAPVKNTANDEINGLNLNSEATTSTLLSESSDTNTDAANVAKLDESSQSKSDVRDESHTTETELEMSKDNIEKTSDAFSKLSMLDDSNSFFSSSAAFQESLLLKNKLDSELRQNQMNGANTSHLPDLLSGIDGYQKPANANEWVEAFKNVMMHNNRQVEEQLLHQQHLQQQQQHHHQQVLQQQEEFLRMHDLQKRNVMHGMSPMNGPHSEFPTNFNGNNSVDLNATQQLLQQQQLQHQLLGDNVLNHSNLFGGNMSKFFDFHKSQQQLHHHQYLNGHSPQSNGTSAATAAVTDPHRVPNFLENGRVNPQFVDNGLLTQQSQVQKQRLLGMFETMSQNQPQSTQQPQQSQQNRFPQSSMADDDLGFDPFIETQKGLAELMENEIVQQQSMSSKLQQQVTHQRLLDNMQRARMPPPGFNHMNAGLGFSNPASRAQNSSKVLPFVNMSGNGAAGGNSSQVGQQQHQMSMSSTWNPHLPPLHQHQGQLMTDSQMQHQLAQAQLASTHNKGYTNNDWTAMDPAILSFRQFSSFPQHGQMPHHQQQQQQQQQQDLLLQHLAQQQQQQQQQNSQGFNNQNPQQQLLPGMHMTNNLLNAQPSTQPQVNANVQGMLEFLKNRQFV